MLTNLKSFLYLKFLKPMIIMILALVLISCNDSRSINPQSTSGSFDISGANDEYELGYEALEIVAKEINATYNKETDDYSIEGESFNIILIPFGFVESGEFEVRVCPSYYPLSVFHYYLVDLKKGTVRER